MNLTSQRIVTHPQTPWFILLINRLEDILLISTQTQLLNISTTINTLSLWELTISWFKILDHLLVFFEFSFDAIVTSCLDHHDVVIGCWAVNSSVFRSEDGVYLRTLAEIGRAHVWTPVTL